MYKLYYVLYIMSDIGNTADMTAPAIEKPLLVDHYLLKSFCFDSLVNFVPTTSCLRHFYISDVALLSPSPVKSHWSWIPLYSRT